MELAMDQLMELGTKAPDHKTELVLELQNNALDPPTFETWTGAVTSGGHCPSPLPFEGLIMFVGNRSRKVWISFWEG
jgi:hypothetical protein